MLDTFDLTIQPNSLFKFDLLLDRFLFFNFRADNTNKLIYSIFLLFYNFHINFITNLQMWMLIGILILIEIL